jgi:uncharacterized repeat protein (TIGR03803 family)
MRPNHLWIAWILLVLSAPPFTSSQPSRAASRLSKEKLIYSFNGTTDGNTPISDLAVDAEGNLYGTTVGGGQYIYGTVFELKRTGHSWKEEVLYSFTGGSDGGEPHAGVVVDAAGNLYGTTLYGGGRGAGTVFELMRDGDGLWTEKVLHNFGSGTDGVFPYAGLSIDAAGNLYGTTASGGSHEGGIVFELIPGAKGNWTEKVLHNFIEPSHYQSGPFGGLAMDAAGNLYGTTLGGGINGDKCAVEDASCGRVFELMPTANGKWIEKTIFLFNGENGANPWAGVVLDSVGNLYGTTYWGGTGRCLNAYQRVSGCGVVFSLIPSANGTWTENVLHSFDNNGFDGLDSFAALASVFVDLNHDRITDFIFSNLFHTPSSDGYVTNASLLVSASGNMRNQVWGRGRGSSHGRARFASALHSGFVVGANKSHLQKSPTALMARLLVQYFREAPKVTTCSTWSPGCVSSTEGQWMYTKHRYLGLKFMIKGEIHYGWARFEVKRTAVGVGKNSISATLTGYAYETVPNKSITTGKTKGPDVVTIEPATLGRLAQGASGTSASREKK